MRRASPSRCLPSPTRAKCIKVKPLAELERAAARRVVGLFTDIDDTLTRDGRLEPEAYDALCRAAAAGLRVVPVTGRPGGWAEVLARLWPVEAMVAENGALYVRSDGTSVYWEDAATRLTQAQELAELVSAVRAELPFAVLVDDQPLRRVDVAFDTGEHQRLTPNEIAQIEQAIRRRGARAVSSTVHTHAFFGDYDKAAMLARIAAERWGETADSLRARYLFVGDSPNDQAAFAFFPLSIGVANVARYQQQLGPPPAYVTRAPFGRGFAELVNFLLE